MDRNTTAVSDSLDVADRLFEAITSGDVEAIKAIYSPDAIIWHNFDGIEQTPEENVRTLAWAIEHLGTMRYTAVRRATTDRGFVQQHVLQVTNRAGVEVEVPACLFVEVEDGRITRLDEYIDSEHVRQMTAS